MRTHQIKLIYLFLGLSLLFSCSKESGEDIAKQQASIVSYLTTNKLAYQEIGEVYKVVNVAGYGYQPAFGDTVTFNYTIYEYNKTDVLTSNVSDTLVKHGFDTEIYKPGPTKMVVGEGSFLAGIREGLLTMYVGEICDIYLTSNLAYGDKPRGPIAGNTMLRVRMQILTVNGSRIIAEKQKISDYIAAEGIAASLKPEGYYFTETVPGEGAKAIVGDTTYVSYVCKTLGGVVVEDIPVADSLSFKIGSGKAPFVGLDLAVRLMAKGTSARIILPSYLAYGKNGKNSIVQPYETLICDVNLYKIITKK